MKRSGNVEGPSRVGSNPLLAGAPFRVNSELVRLSKSSRRMAVLLKRASRNLARIKKLEERRAYKKQNMDIRAQVKTLKARNRIDRLTTLRVRTKDELGQVYLPQTRFRLLDPSGRIVSSYLGTPLTVQRGRKQSIQDYHPVARLNPSRNQTSIKSYRINSNVASISTTSTQPYVWLPSLAACHWCIEGLNAYSISSDISQAVEFSTIDANKALLKAFAKINDADIQMNEYLFEYKQVLQLLGNPMRTALRLLKSVDRWMKRDAWIFLPQRTYRKVGGGLLVSKPPTGGILMSMRTRRTLDLSSAPDQLTSAAANRWLQYRYGIMPLVSDITSAMTWYERYHTVPKQWNRSETARHHVRRSSFRTEYKMDRPDGLGMIYDCTYVSGLHYTAKVWYRIKYDPPLSYKLGVHPSQWLQALWNAVPYSFVADWVVNLDDWLSAIREPPWIEVGPNVVTVKVYDKVSAHCKKVYCGSLTLKANPGLPSAIKVREMMRREIDLPKVTEPVLSSRWQTMKNAVTALALVYKPLTKTYRR